MAIRNNNTSQNSATTAGSVTRKGSRPITLQTISRKQCPAQSNFRRSTWLDEYEEKNPYEEKIEKWTKRLSDKLLRTWNTFYDKVLFPAKRVLYKTGNSKTINDECERLSPKIPMVVLGIVLVLVSAAMFSVQIIPKDVIDATMPSLSFVCNVPILMSVGMFLLGLWMTASHPKKGRGHGIFSHELLSEDSLDVRNERKRDEIEGKLLRHYQMMYFDMLDLLHLNGKNPFRHTLWKSSCKAMDETVKALSFGKIDVPSFSFFSMSCDEQSSMSKDEIDSLVNKYKESSEAFAHIMKIWRATFAFGRNTQFVIYDIRSDVNAETLDDIVRVGQALGIEDSVNAYMQGVPIEDVIA